MNILGINLGSNEDPGITQDDREWVVENMKWLRDSLGYPVSDRQRLLTPEFFPTSFASEKVTIETVADDLSRLLGLPRSVFRIEVLIDVRDMDITPWELGETMINTDVRLRKGDHIIYVARCLQKTPSWLIHCMILEFVKVRMSESGLQFDDFDDTNQFAYLAAIYYDLGLVLANNMHGLGQSLDTAWSETVWNLSLVPPPVFAFGLAVYAAMLNEPKPSWAESMKKDIRKQFTVSLAYVFKHLKSELYDEKEALSDRLFDKAEEQFNSGEFEMAMGTLQKILFLSEDPYTRSITYNNIGYHHSIADDYSKAIPSFESAIAEFPDFPYAYDNLGFAWIMTGDLEKGLSYLRRAQEVEGYSVPYNDRNLAIYHHRRKEHERAREYFTKALASGEDVDLLEYFYALLLLEEGDNDAARTYVLRSVAKKERQGIALATKLGWI